MAKDTNSQPPVIAIALAVISALTAIAVALITTLPATTGTIDKHSSGVETSTAAPISPSKTAATNTTSSSETATINTPISPLETAAVNQDTSAQNTSASTTDKSSRSKDINQSEPLEDLSQQPLSKASNPELKSNSGSEPVERVIKNPANSTPKTESKLLPAPVVQPKIAHTPQPPTTPLTILHTQNGTGRSPHTDSYAAYKTWGGSNWKAWIYGNNQFKHQQQQATTSHNDVIINYISWDGHEWTATVDTQRKVFTHTRRGATTSHEDTILNYLTWNGEKWTMSLQ